MRFPDQHLAVATLCNTQANLGVFNRKIVDLYLGGAFKDAALSSDGTQPALAPKAVDASGLNLGDYAGDYYSDEVQTTYRFIVEGKELTLFGRKSNNREARPIGNDHFFFSPGMDLHFVRDAQNHQFGFTLALAFTTRDEAYSARPSVTFRRIQTGALPGVTRSNAPAKDDRLTTIRVNAARLNN
jgi:hypothetical protein